MIDECCENGPMKELPRRQFGDWKAIPPAHVKCKTNNDPVTAYTYHTVSHKSFEYTQYFNYLT
jgi:hypothetical protein